MSQKLFNIAEKKSLKKKSFCQIVINVFVIKRYTKSKKQDKQSLK